MQPKYLKQGTTVKFRLTGDNTYVGMGKIVGVASTGVPILGISYIIEPFVPLQMENYLYSHFVCFESWLDVVENESN